LLGAYHLLETYMHGQYRYSIKNLYYIDWNFVDGSSADDRIRFAEDYNIPPVSVLQYAQSVLKSKIPEPKSEKKALVFVHRSGNVPRTVNNPQTLYDELQKLCDAYGLDFIVHGVDGNYGPLEEQMEIYSRAVVVVGAQGGGLANMIFCDEGTVMLEIPAFPYKLSENVRLATILNLTYASLPKAQLFNYYKSLNAYPQTLITNIIKSLENILLDKGYPCLDPDRPQQNPNDKHIFVEAPGI